MQEDATHNRTRAQSRICPTRDGIALGAVLFLTALICIVTFHHRASDAYEAEVRSHLLDMARAAGSLIDSGRHEQLISPEQEGSELHQELIAPLSGLLKSVPGIRHVYTMVMRDGQPHFVLDAPSPFEPNDDVAGVIEPYDDADPEMLIALREGRELVTREFYSDEWGTFISAYAPLHNSAGELIGIVGVDVTADEYLARMAAMRRAVYLVLSVAFILSMAGGLAVWGVRRGNLRDRITLERMVDELQRRESELHKLSMVAARTHNGVIVADADGRIEWVNEGFTRITGYTLDEVIGRNPGHVLRGPKSDPDTARMMSGRLCAGEDFHAEILNYAKDGREYWAAIDMQPVRDDAGRIVNFMSMQADITESKKAEAELALSHERFEMLGRATQDVVWDLDVPTGDVWWNQNLLTAFGYDPNTIERTVDGWLSMIHEDDRARVCQSFHDAMEGDSKHWVEEYRVVCADGGIAHVYDRGYIIRDESGEAVRCVGAMVDLTEQKRSTEQIAFQKTLLESQTEASPDGMLVVGADRRIISYNQRFIEMWGIPANALETHDDRAVISTVLDRLEDPDEFVTRVDELHDQPERVATDEIKLRDGRTFERHSTPIRGKDGADYGRVWFFRDITEMKRYAEQLEQHKLVVENSNAVLFRWRAVDGWPVELVSDNVLQFGYTAEELLDGRTAFATMIHPDDRDRVANEVREYGESGVDSFEQEYRLICPDGRMRWIYDRSVVERGEDGSPHHFQGIVFDITERKESDLRTAQLVWQLAERIKENETLLRVLDLMHESAGNVGDLLRSIVEILPEGFKCPERTAAEIRFAGQAYHTERYSPSDTGLLAEFNCADGSIGELHVVLVGEDDGEADDVPFMREERQLLDAVAEALQSHLDRLRIQEQLRQQQLVVDNSNTVLFRWRVADDWPVELVSDNVRHFGYEPVDLREGRVRFESIVHPDDRRRVEQDVIDLLDSGHDAIDQEYRIVCANGDERWVYDRTKVERDADGNATHIQGIVIDVTDRKLAEEARRESEERLRRIASQVPGALYQFRLAPDGERSFPYISDGIEQLCGFAPEDLYADSQVITNHVVPEDAEALEASIVESAQTMQPWRQQFRIRHRDGSIRWISGNSVPQREPDGAILWHGLIVDITEQHKAEEELHRLTAILDVSPDLVGMSNVDLEPIYINRAGRRMLGIGPDEELAGISVVDLSATWAAELLKKEAIPAAIRDGIWVGETAFLAEDGSEIPVSQVILAHKDADGNLAYLSTVARDLTPQKRIEQEIRRSQQFLRSTLDALSAHIAILDSSGRIIEVNQAWREFAVENSLENRHFGIGSNYLETCERATGDWADEAAPAAANLRKLLAGELDQFSIEYPCHSPDQQRWFMARATHFDADSSRYAVVAHENITAHKLSEEAIRTNELRLRRQTQALVDVAHSTIIEETAIDAAIRQLTRVAASTFGVERASIWFCEVDPSRIVCQDLYELSLDQHSCGVDFYERDLPAYFDAMKNERVLVLSDAQNDHRTAEFLDGYLKPLDIRSMLDVPIWSNGGLIGVLCLEHVGNPRKWTVDEVSFAASLSSIVALLLETFRRRETEQRLVLARDEAEAANRAKSEFLANMSHEIRTPMTAILGYADLLTDATVNENERLGYVNTIRRNGDLLLNIINDILDISKIESGKMTVERVNCSPVTVVEEAVSLMRARAIERNLSLDLEYASDVPEAITTDPVRLRQVLHNLLGNAIKFTREGGVRVVARYDRPADDSRGESAEGRLCFDTIDTGIGLTAEQINRIFQPFVQADTSVTRRFGGTGLGLAISQRLAHLLDGEITVQSNPGRGSTFTMALRTTHDEGVRMIRPGGESIQGVEEPQPKQELPRIAGRILLAEDGPDNQRLLSFFLKSAGAEVTIVANGQEAIDAVNDAEKHGRGFDLILMDMQMPVMDGYNATKQLRAQGYGGLILALTAHAMTSDRDKCLKAGCDEYLVKPIDRHTLVTTVDRCLTMKGVEGMRTSRQKGIKG
jgi:PAS domain S-box-containing protein